MLAAQLTKAPANLAEGPWMWSAQRDGESEAVSIARVVRYGIPGTDMPGHETWTTDQWQAVTSYLLKWRK
jgi:cytochrome c oxidase cbb3-type subunit 2